MYKVTEHIPRNVCRDDLMKKLRAIGIKTDGYVYSLEKFLKSKGFGLPVPAKETEAFCYVIGGKYYSELLNYADALASEIIDLKRLGYL